MKRKHEKGYTGIDIATSVVVLFLFISLIASLSYRFNRSAKEIQLKTEAIDNAIKQIEYVKSEISFSEIEEIEIGLYGEETEIDQKFLSKIWIQDYHNIDSSKEAGIVKKVTVEVSYYFDQQPQTIKLSTIIAKER